MTVQLASPMSRDTIRASVERLTERESAVRVALGAHTRALHLSAWEPVWHAGPATLDFVAVGVSTNETSQLASATGRHEL